MSIFFEILVRIASYGPQIDQSHGENRLSHIIRYCISSFKSVIGRCHSTPFVYCAWGALMSAQVKLCLSKYNIYCRLC